MPRITPPITLWAAAGLAAVLIGQSAYAQQPAQQPGGPAMPRFMTQPNNAQPLPDSQGANGNGTGAAGAPQFHPPTPIAGGPGQLPPTHLTQPGYPYLGAPMYPSPQPYVPAEVGSTFITNQALAPHEMLYPHCYHAMYPPFYHKVKGRWVMTGSGVRYREDWYLQGTEVKVKYNGHISPLSLFHAPVGNTHFSSGPNIGWRTSSFFH
jgi:hypothetical protein